MADHYPIWQIDAFADRPFTGNPAAVMPLSRWIPETLMQAIAEENNLAETVFFVPAEGGATDYDIRWFTPEVEIALCGHATLAAAHVLWSHLGFEGDRVRFGTRTAGVVEVGRREGLYVLDFPAYAVEPVPALLQLDVMLGAAVAESWRHDDYVLAVLPTQADVAALQPDFARLRALDAAVIVTAAGESHDFVSRFFAPALGVNEDPVTGSAHCRLIPFWAQRLGKSSLTARQLSRRGGELVCEWRGDRVDIGGRCVDVMAGTMIL